ncbi:dihydrofolate reductase [Putridiphycobacter roseus]|uniref:Dihydrofolate reductase n=1 Tax=Putridiphycobacter roseus TaxID=2219161 RepID=A0A2W1MZK6_9FLAO|nr:dihydrofolate reductase family protein [Putridiphycobacter roseus]PZE16700.1 dihydrofolate reductase [Putridiphycobacter roseus]
MGRKLVLYIAMSLDGYIATESGSIDFLSIVNSDKNEDFGHGSFMQSVDTVIWGRKTYEKVLSFGEELPYADKKKYVISKQKKEGHGLVEFTDDVVDLIYTLKNEEGKDIYCDGGGEIVSELLKNKLFDQLIISIVPHILGDGIRLFQGGSEAQGLKLKNSITFPSGLVQLNYKVI